MEPESGADGAFEYSGLLTNKVADVEVRFDGTPAPLFHVEPSRITVQVPYTVLVNATAHLEVYALGTLIAATDVPVAAAAPGVFPAVANPDGSLNSEDAPAPRGNIATLYATGEGLTDGGNITGLPATTPYPQPRQSLSVSIGGIPAEILYAGGAPGMVGLLQVNVRIPGAYVASGAAPLELRVGDVTAPDVTVWLK